jgi:hypothetical protein
LDFVPPDLDFVPSGFDFLLTDFEFVPHVFEIGKGRGVDPSPASKECRHRERSKAI